MGEVHTHLIVYCIYTTQYPKHVKSTLSRTQFEKTQKIPSYSTYGNPHSPLYKCYHRDHYNLGASFLMPFS